MALAYLKLFYLDCLKFFNTSELTVKLIVPIVFEDKDMIFTVCSSVSSKLMMNLPESYMLFSTTLINLHVIVFVLK